MATGYNGGKGVSNAKQELLANSKNPRKYYEFSFLNKQECSVIVNDSDPIPCPAGVGFVADANDAKISSFIVLESGIEYTWRGKY